MPLYNPTGNGTVTTTSVVSANGLAGTVANATTTPALTLSTTVNSPVLAGNGTAIAAATTTGSGSTAVLATGPTMTNPVVGTQTQLDGSTKAASTAYVDTAVANAVAGVNPAVAVQAATTSAGNTSGFTYNNGASGIGATFTGTTNTAITIDGYTFTALGQRLLVKNDTQSPSGAFNGVYYVTQVQTGILPPILTRALDYDQPSDINNTGAIPVINGTVNGTTSWVQTSQIVTVGTTPLTFTQFTFQTSVTSFTGDGTVLNNSVSTGAVTGTLATHAAGLFLAGPASGSSATPTFRAIASADYVVGTVQAQGMVNVGLTTSVAASALTIALKQNDGSTDPAAGIGSVQVAFRSSTATTGGYTLVASTAATSIVVPSSATLGQTSAIAAYIWVYAINNAGTLELAVSGVKLFDDYSIASSTTISSGATSGTVLYSTTGRSNVPIRLIGRILITEATAGTWASGATEVALASGKQSPTITEWVSFTPTGGWSTNTTYAGFWRRVGDTIEVQTKVTVSGAPTSASLSLNLPSTFAIDTNKVLQTTGNRAVLQSSCTIHDQGVAAYYAQVCYNNSTTSVVVAYISGSLGVEDQVTQAVPFTFGNTDNVVCTYAVPISGWSTYGP